jgi:hypothetical protein
MLVESSPARAPSHGVHWSKARGVVIVASCLLQHKPFAYSRESGNPPVFDRYLFRHCEEHLRRSNPGPLARKTGLLRP